MIPVKILFVLRDFEHGGIARCLVNLCDRLDCSRVNASVFVCNPTGIFAGRLKNCDVLPYNWGIRLLTCNYRKEKGWVKYLAILIKLLRHGLIKLYHKDSLFEYVVHRCAQTFLLKDYDVLWACSEDCPAKIVEYSNPEFMKVLWIHNNYSYCFELMKPHGFPDWSVFDKIVCVSKHSANALKKVLLEKERIKLYTISSLYNIVNADEILEQGKMPVDDSEFFNHIFTIVSVGRLAWEKNFESIPKIASKLKKLGLDFVWYVVGGGSDLMRDIIVKEISKQCMEDYVKLLGVKKNPYAYIAKSDVLVITSRYETYPTVVNEAKTLGIPVISTDIQGIDEILFAADGWICPLEKISDILSHVIRNGIPEYMKRKKDFSSHNRSVISMFERILLEDKVLEK
jgi:glycosyltransferase, family 1